MIGRDRYGKPWSWEGYTLTVVDPLDEPYETLDSGERQHYPSGMRRDTRTGKPRFDLLDQEFLRRWAELMARGAEKYGERNWELANSEEELDRFRESAFRHFYQWAEGDTKEDHAAAVAFNIAAFERTKKIVELKMEYK